MRDKRPVAVYHEFSAREARIRVRAAQQKTPGWVDEDACIFIGRQCPQGGNEDFFPERLFKLRRPDIVPVLGGQYHRIQPHWLSVPVFHRDLGFPVRQQALCFSRLAHIGKPPGDAVRQHHRQRHFLRRFAAGVAHHHALVAGAKLHSLRLPGPCFQRAGHARRYIRALPVQKHLQRIAVLRISHPPQYVPDDLRYTRDMAAGGLARHQYMPFRCHHLAGHTRGHIEAQAFIQNAVRDNIAYLIRMPLRHRFRSVFFHSHSPCPTKIRGTAFRRAPLCLCVSLARTFPKV